MNNASKKFQEVILAEFETPGALLKAAKRMQDAGYKKYDCHSPFPIHGMDNAMGMKRSPIGYIVAVMGFIGLTGMLTLTWWTNIEGYPMVISGKPHFSWQAFIPIIFAITVLFGAFGAFFGMLGMNRLPRLFHPIFYSEKFSKVTNDGFFVSVESDDSKYDVEKVKSFLESLGGKNVEVVKKR
ncbi:MAG: DUF3341 domain-containing protein [Candidatus Zixiibacteriota bacterium]